MGRQKMRLAFLLWGASFVFLFYTMEPIVHPGILLCFLLPVFVFLTLNEKVSFLLFIIFTTLFSLLLLSWAFIDNWSTITQLKWIGIHAVVLVHLWSSYVIAKWTSYLIQKNRELSKKVIELEEYIADTQILSKREFEKQKNLIVTTMVRKKEAGFLVYVNMDNLPTNVKKTSFAKVSEVVYQSIREYFDIVGKHETNKIVFLLQNTNEQGLNVVKNRIISKLSLIYTEEALSALEWKSEHIGYGAVVEEVREGARS
ncbi:hypothetical protein [Halobacillus sp. BBL2006]|uniref:hypothetical protein n=1 Tax=Halobacillus sp. BBL2006 TaxID=1543706 RepID=UPI000543A39D|nr:hypothetical protein [Halobacillus sp. BBL2006]KHE71493.1 hypothetical protein LD39_09495 [Halobacillus sp. BBL2006]